MIRHLAVISVLTIAATATFPAATQAETAGPATISFNGTVQSQCTVTTQSNGTLKGNISPLATGFVTDAPGVVIAKCNSEGGVSSTPSQASGNPKKLGVISSFLPLDSVAGNGQPHTVQVYLTAGNGNNVMPAGLYNFSVTVTVAP